jgi:hypothetical protein
LQPLLLLLCLCLQQLAKQRHIAEATLEGLAAQPSLGQVSNFTVQQEKSWKGCSLSIKLFSGK